MHSLSHITPSAGTFAGTSAPAHYMAARENTDVCQAAGKGFSSQATAELPWASGGNRKRHVRVVRGLKYYLSYSYTLWLA